MANETERRAGMEEMLSQIEKQDRKLSRNSTVTLGLAISLIGMAITLTWHARGIVEQMAAMTRELAVIKEAVQTLEARSTTRADNEKRTDLRLLQLEQAAADRWTRTNEHVAWQVNQEWTLEAIRAAHENRTIPLPPNIERIPRYQPFDFPQK